MTVDVRTCAACGLPLPERATARRRFCKDNCRARAYKARRAVRYEAACALLRAVLDGDRAALASTTDTARRLLPA